VIAPDYKIAESVLKESAEKAIEKIEYLGGEGAFHRHAETAKV
jgi:translation initiation factor 2 subunit 1